MNEKWVETKLETIHEGVKTIREKYETLEKNNSSFESRMAELKETIEKVKAKIDDLEIKQKTGMTTSWSYEIRSPNMTTSWSYEIRSPKMKALMDWARTGKEIEIPEMKVMRLSDATLGGYLTTPDVTAELLKGIVEYSPIRQYAKVRATSRESVQFRKRTGTFTAQWTGETGTKTETTGLTYGREIIPTHELYALVDISNWDLEDSDFNLEQELQMEFSEQFGKSEGEAFIKGDGVGKPEGILTNPFVGEVMSGSANSLTADGFFRLYFAPKSAYTKNAKWIMNRSTMFEASILKDAQGNYLLRRLGESATWSILGAEVIEAVDVPDVAVNAYPVIFGDLSNGYLIVDRIAIAILRDPYSAASQNAVRFHARKRVGGQVVLAEAIWKMKISA